MDKRLIFCSDCKYFIKIGVCKKEHNIDEITPSICKDAIDKEVIIMKDDIFTNFLVFLWDLLDILRIKNEFFEEEN